MAGKKRNTPELLEKLKAQIIPENRDPNSLSGHRYIQYKPRRLYYCNRKWVFELNEKIIKSWSSPHAALKWAIANPEAFPKKPGRLSEDQILKIFAMSQEGFNLSEIGRHLDLTPARVYKVLNYDFDYVIDIMDRVESINISEDFPRGSE